MKAAIFTFTLFFLFSINLLANVKPNSLFADSMVIQQGMSIPVWGTADENEAVSVEFCGQKVSTITKNGKWLVRLKSLQYGGPFEMIIKGNNRIVLSNILVGEVWVCSGQSNMEFPLNEKRKVDSVNYENEVAEANFNNIRFFKVKKDNAQTAQVNCIGSWVSCSPSTTANFSAVAYYFGKKLYQHLNVPIGLIQDAYSGSAIQAWIKQDVLMADSELKLKYIDTPPAAADIKRVEMNSYKVYNAMLAPIIPFAIKGVIWYQGESNVGDKEIYTKANIAMINDWRKDWGINFSFYAVQMTPRFYKDKQTNDTNFGRGIFRECQSAIMVLPKTGIVVTSDLMYNNDERSDSHPRNKKDVGMRLALWALAKDYGKKIQYLGPEYKALKIKNDIAYVSFKKRSLGGGLCTKDGSKYVKSFKIAGTDGKFYPAIAVIDGNNVVISSPNVRNPVAVRYAYTDGAISNLQNKEGLAAFPFRTDSFQSSIAVAVDMPELY